MRYLLIGRRPGNFKRCRRAIVHLQPMRTTAPRKVLIVLDSRAVRGRIECRDERKRQRAAQLSCVIACALYSASQLRWHESATLPNSTNGKGTLGIEPLDLLTNIGKYGNAV